MYIIRNSHGSLLKRSVLKLLEKVAGFKLFSKN